MKKILTPALVALAAVALVRGAVADTIPFPAVHSGDVFVIAQTVTTTGAMTNYYAPGSTVVFRAYAVDGKSHQILSAKTVKYFYVKIPNQPNVKMKYGPKAPGASGQYTWTGTWTVPANYPLGLVQFKVLVKSKAKRLGSFVQMPVPTAMLTITANPPQPGAGPGATPPPSGKQSVVLYADSVNGSKSPRPNGSCTQTNVYKRGEQLVLRTWGYDLTTGAVLSIDNVTDAHYTVPGQPNVMLNWGSHGAAKVFFWTNFWSIPATFPLGDTVIHVSFTLTNGKTATLDYPITIIP